MSSRATADLPLAVAQHWWRRASEPCSPTAPSCLLRWLFVAVRFLGVAPRNWGSSGLLRGVAGRAREKMLNLFVVVGVIRLIIVAVIIANTIIIIILRIIIIIIIVVMISAAFAGSSDSDKGLSREL